MTQTTPMLDTIVSPETQAKFTDAVASLAQSLGVAASHVYEVLVRQAYAEAIGFLIPAIFCIALVVWMWRIRSRAAASIRSKRSPEAIEVAYQKYRRKYPNESVYTRESFDRVFKSDHLEPISREQTTVEVFTGLSGLLFIGGICLLVPAVMRFINPEYYAIQEVLSLLR